jgi:predicted nucleic acid-binding protein
VSALVLDASVSLAWFFDDQASDEAFNVLSQVAEQGAIVPSHWALEVANALLLAIRTDRTTSAKRDEFLRLLDDAPIEMDVLIHSRAGHETLELALEHGLTSYDAAYLELARRRDLPLATRVRRLAKAARASGVTTITP